MFEKNLEVLVNGKSMEQTITEVLESKGFGLNLDSSLLDLASLFESEPPSDKVTISDFKSGDYVITNDGLVGRVAKHGIIDGVLTVQAQWVDIFNNTMAGEAWYDINFISEASDCEILLMLETIVDELEGGVL